MKEIIANYMSNLDFGELQEFHNMGVIPIFTSVSEGPVYFTLKEALDKKLISISEIDEGGSVPELRVLNEAGKSVLLLDGEELAGAKQNRLINTTILLAKKSETLIPVSCTEHGRWSYTSRDFADSDVVLSKKIRHKKHDSVLRSLKNSGRFNSDQGEIWQEIDSMSSDAGVDSETGAMKDVYEGKMKDLDEYFEAFKYEPGQKGLLVFINGKISGCDIVSLKSAYKVYHEKLVKSYAMDAYLEKKKSDKKDVLEKGKAFLKEAGNCTGEKYKSTGHGWDYRFEGDRVVGSALVYRNRVIHLALFLATKENRTDRMASARSRRRYRM